MRIEVLSGRELTSSEVERWSELQRNDPDLESPFFSPLFTQAVAAVRDDIHVAVLTDGRRVVGFFPFQRGRLGVGRPAGGALSDYEGVIAERDLVFDAVELLRGCRLRIFDFAHLVDRRGVFSSFVNGDDGSPILDLSCGFDAWVATLKAADSRLVEALARKRRKLEREVGPLRFEAHRYDLALLRRVMDLKSEQCRRKGSPDIFAFGWTRALLERILGTQTEEFAGMLSCLHAGGRLAAAQMGMRSCRSWHWWFPVYSQELARYSPGKLLLVQMAKHAGELGLNVIDFGKGADPYKLEFANAMVPLFQGSAALPSLAVRLRTLGAAVKGLVRRSGAPIPGRAILHRLAARQRFR